MLVIHLSDVTQKTCIYVVQKIPLHAHACFLLDARLDPCHHPTRYPISQCHNGIIKVLWLGIMCMLQLRHHRETACHSQPPVIPTWQIR